MNKNVRSIIAISGKFAYLIYNVYQTSQCEFLLLRYAPTHIIHINKNLTIIFEFTVYEKVPECCSLFSILFMKFYLPCEIINNKVVYAININILMFIYHIQAYLQFPRTFQLMTSYCKFRNYCVHLLLHFFKNGQKCEFYYCNFEKSSYRSIFQLSECEFLLLRYSPSRIICINKNLAIISEFTVLDITDKHRKYIKTNL